MSRTSLLFACLLVLLFGVGPAQAHQVPNMTVEATFEPEGKFEMKVNLDPRVFLSTNPTSLPPVSADWYLNQTEDQVQKTYAQAAEHLKKHLEVKFGGQAQALPEVSWQAMDGATNKPLTRETAEAHLLGTLRGTVPAGKGDFALGFAKEAVVSLILLLKTPEMPEPKVQVLFPGESSRAIAVPTAAAAPVEAPPPSPVTPAADQPRRAMGWTGWLAGIVGLVAVTSGWFLATRRKR
ncbi:hypothetical protein [Brevifollis gellanilyticus]|uniref:DUF1775 domain-containing protein n=1 Tax=Brevifollis gellanilyticus TaxID=748831 RepID=A0A512MI14_9BACT|nr:hypothetical protein [Brevifollis gellanilyticus]GEP45971.1 hypothetical protein BGE01nite_52620 [Brevifollis gellanilyticus]